MNVLPWLKLDVVDFLQSESVMKMSLEEVGAYLLLLMQAWAQAKDCTLPDDLKLLSQMAKGKKISPRVLALFPIVDTQWGKRRRNGRLYATWEAAQEKSEVRAKVANARWDAVRKAKAEAKAVQP
jgi:uncharacterized protein YdaU (DUF1376 family)